MNGAVDLFGHPVDAQRRLPGRPRHVPTPELRSEVQRLHDLGQSQSEIAAAVGVTEPTLRLHYHTELRSRSRAWRRWANDEGK